MITYKVKPEFKKYASYLEGNYFPQNYDKFEEDTSRYKLYKDAGVLDIWFDKIEPRKRFELTPVSEPPTDAGVYVFFEIGDKGNIVSCGKMYSDQIEQWEFTHWLKEIK